MKAECYFCGREYDLNKLHEDLESGELYCDSCGEKGDYYANLNEEEDV